jgi:uncharacterized protein
MIAIDTNLLVYAHRPEMAFHERAREVLGEAVNGPEPVCVPWPCAHEFLAVVTNPRIFKEPTPMDLALDASRQLLTSLSGGFLAEGNGYLDTLERIARPANLRGAIVHDARVAALCLFHGVRVLWSADRDFSRFPALTVANPLPVV